MKSTLLNILNKNESREGIRLNRRVITFLFCVFISIFFWLLMALSKEDSISVSFPVNYINMPSDKVISNTLPENINIEIKSNGFNLLLYKLVHKRETVLIDIKDSKPLPTKNHYYLFTNSRIDKITSQFNNDIKIMKVEPDTIFFNYNKKITKSVPVKAVLYLDFERQYQQSDSIKLKPAYINVSGTSELIDKIKFVETQPLSLKKINNSMSVNLTIAKRPELKNVEFSTSTVQALIHVTKFTEANIKLSVEVINLPVTFELKTYPEKINVRYNVAFEDYEKINPVQFRAIVDYKKIEPGSNKLKVQLEKYPSEIRAIKINPEKVEYIIRKK